MKNLLILCIFTAFLSCDKDECTQQALCTQMNSGLKNDLIEICHYGSTILVDDDSVQSHLDHGDTIGACQTLSNDSLPTYHNEIVEIDCKYDLPFIHVDSNFNYWLYEEIN